ncbi:hypothetical protein BUALT_Bualt12G0130300 [Buddleja alternifolia]|uniref:Uncharacterized protein n=1 Tax=Buddleja alternifolia TaxID=168488 RepID=A0AAV6WRG9_9LAMI|nr:hypothetical protein BUALT_Bualt12G0130300 [Buddleja alternifolia]
MVRSSCVDKNGLRKGAWTQEEDNKLGAYILRYGHWNWRLLPQYAGLARCGKSCRLRWMNYLKPGIKRGAYSKEEEDLIAKLHHELGNKWSVIAAKLPGRTDNEIKNYWHTHLKNGSKRKSSKSSRVMSSDVLIFQNQEQNNISNNENMISRRLKNSNSNSGNLENLEASSSDHHIHILESTTSCTSLNWNSADSTTTSTSPSSRSANYYSYTTTAQQQQQQQLQKSSCFLSYDDLYDQPAAAALLPSQTTDSTQLQNIIQGDDIFSRATHDPSDITFGGFGDSFWTQPFLVDTQIDYNYNNNFSLLDDDEDASFIFTNSSDI